MKSAATDNQIEQNILSLFSKSQLISHNYTYKREVIGIQNGKTRIFDIVIYKDKLPYAVLEIKKALKPDTIEQAKLVIQSGIGCLSCAVGIITDGKTYLLFKNNDFVDNPIVCDSFNQLLIELENNENITDENITNSFSELYQVLKKIDCEEFKYDIAFKDGKYIFIHNKEEFFWKKIIQHSFNNQHRKILRYTSLNSVHAIINNKTFRMNGLAGMNDISEVGFYDMEVNEIKGTNLDPPNDVYISSCCQNEDDLTMWRLYGDDGRGVCLEFEEIENASEKFDIFQVCYVNKNADNNVLQLIRDLKNRNMYFEFENKWKHFFKPHEYEIEREIRILYQFDLENITPPKRINNPEIKKGWVITSDHSIVNPYVDIPLDEVHFPLKLVRITLGPTCPNKELNKKQIKKMLEANGFLDVQCELSKITTYR